MTLSVTFMFYMAPMHMSALINLYAFSPINLLQQTQLPTLKGKAWTSYIILLQLRPLVCLLQLLLTSLLQHTEQGGRKQQNPLTVPYSQSDKSEVLPGSQGK